LTRKRGGGGSRAKALCERGWNAQVDVDEPGGLFALALGALRPAKLFRPVDS
jgi:hypothetical protein